MQWGLAVELPRRGLSTMTSSSAGIHGSFSTSTRKDMTNAVSLRNRITALLYRALPVQVSDTPRELQTINCVKPKKNLTQCPIFQGRTESGPQDPNGTGTRQGPHGGFYPYFERCLKYVLFSCFEISYSLLSLILMKVIKF